MKLGHTVKVKATNQIGTIERVSQKLGILVRLSDSDSRSFRQDELERLARCPKCSQLRSVCGNAATCAPCGYCTWVVED